MGRIVLTSVAVLAMVAAVGCVPVDEGLSPVRGGARMLSLHEGLSMVNRGDDSNTHSFEFTPTFGFIMVDNLALTMSPGYSWYKEKGVAIWETTRLAVGADYTFYRPGVRWAPFVRGELGFASVWGQEEIFDTHGKTTAPLLGAGAGFRFFHSSYASIDLAVDWSGIMGLTFPDSFKAEYDNQHELRLLIGFNLHFPSMVVVQAPR